jgi:hypothetical protein
MSRGPECSGVEAGSAVPMVRPCSATTHRGAPSKFVHRTVNGVREQRSVFHLMVQAIRRRARMVIAHTARRVVLHHEVDFIGCYFLCGNDKVAFVLTSSSSTTITNLPSLKSSTHPRCTQSKSAILLSLKFCYTSYIGCVAMSNIVHCHCGVSADSSSCCHC